MAVLSILLATRPMTRWKETRGSKLHSTLIPAALLVALACCITLGCASKPAASDDAAAVEAYATRGYEHHFETTTTRDTWTIDSEPTDVKLILPLHATSYPLSARIGPIRRRRTDVAASMGRGRVCSPVRADESVWAGTVVVGRRPQWRFS
jgi:hypothetical protein